MLWKNMHLLAISKGCIGQTKTEVDGHHKENHVDAPPKHSIIVSWGIYEWLSL